MGAWTYTDDTYGVGDGDSCGCPACVEVLGKYRPDRFPTIEEYRKLEAEWPTALYPSGEDLDKAWIAKVDEWERRHANCEA